ncbi:hypothetical protein BMG523Draft_02067 [Frankia sp. BMG5.23]|nr:hypothetical protein BMG523Draft_02067 [Frankia sp. BMG5.23]
MKDQSWYSHTGEETTTAAIMEIFRRIVNASRMPKKYRVQSFAARPSGLNRLLAGRSQYGALSQSKMRGSKMKQTTPAIANARSAMATRLRSSRRCSVSGMRLSSTVRVRR